MSAGSIAATQIKRGPIHPTTGRDTQTMIDSKRPTTANKMKLETGPIHRKCRLTM